MSPCQHSPVECDTSLKNKMSTALFINDGLEMTHQLHSTALHLSKIRQQSVKTSLLGCKELILYLYTCLCDILKDNTFSLVVINDPVQKLIFHSKKYV